MDVNGCTAVYAETRQTGIHISLLFFIKERVQLNCYRHAYRSNFKIYLKINPPLAIFVISG